MDVREKLIDRVRKLLELGDVSRNNSVEEAATAASLAQRLMIEHKISMTEIDIDEDPIIDVDVMAGEKTVNVITWKLKLLNGIANNCFCRVVYSSARRRTLICSLEGALSELPPKKGQLRVLGKKDDVDLVVYLYKYLGSEINRLCEIEVEFACGGTRSRNKRCWRSSFRLGAVYRISCRLEEQRLRKEEELRQQSTVSVDGKAYKGGACLAMMRKADAEVERFVKEKINPRTGGSRTVIIEGDAYTVGMFAADQIDLERDHKGLPKPIKHLP